MHEFGSILQATLTPIALISGVGLLLLSMTNRYNHAIDRIRYLVRERRDRPEEITKINESIQVIYSRCRMMRNAILCIGISIVGDAVLVFATLVEGFTTLNLFWLKSALLIASVGFTMIAGILFVREVTFSLHAIHIELES